MTEMYEVHNWIEELESIAADMRYESSTKPGPGEEVTSLFSDAAKKVEEAITIAQKAESLMPEYTNAEASIHMAAVVHLAAMAAAERMGEELARLRKENARLREALPSQALGDE